AGQPRQSGVRARRPTGRALATPAALLDQFQRGINRTCAVRGAQAAQIGIKGRRINALTAARRCRWYWPRPASIIILQIADKSLICGEGVRGRFTAKLLKV